MNGTTFTCSTLTTFNAPDEIQSTEAAQNRPFVRIRVPEDQNNPEWCARADEAIANPPQGYIRPLVTYNGSVRDYRKRSDNNDDIDHYTGLQAMTIWYSRLQARTQTEIYSDLRDEQRIPSSIISGILTTRQGVEMNFLAGTNRRVIATTFENWLGYTFQQLHDPSQGGHMARQDVSRTSLQVFNDLCRGCHRQMDSLANASFLMDYQSNARPHR